MEHVSFKVSREAGTAILSTVKRFQSLLLERGLPSVDAMDLHMDLTACHANGCPIDWERLNSADNFTFVHDVAGIQRHINRRTGKLEHCFMPRCAQKEQHL